MFLSRLDMRLTDNHILGIFKAELGSQPGEITLGAVASKAGCSSQTVFRAVQRLKSAGLLTSEWQGFSKPCKYQVVERNE